VIGVALKVKEVEISKVIPYENNPRKNDDAVKYVVNSLKEFGWQQPIVCDADGVVIAGHTRLKAAKQLGMKTVPVVYADDLTPEQVQAYRIADNKVGEQAEWNFFKLSNEIAGIEYDMEDFGFSEFEIESLSSLSEDIYSDSDEDDSPAPMHIPYEPVVMPETADVVVSDEDVKNTEVKMDDKIKKSFESIKYRTVICPHCGEEFQID
jgi:site-specific DNA-methyltransferase (adenine-specific)